MKTQLVLLMLAAALLAGCKDAPAPSGGASSPGAPTAGSTPVSLDTIAAQAQGFNVGPTMSARVVYVFFDPQCPHCAALWQAAKPLKTQARFVWIPVSLLNAKSTTQGATLLAAQDPVTAMDGHEVSLREGRGGIPEGSGLDAQTAAIKRNTELFNSFGFASVPTIVSKNAQTGEVIKREGALQTQALAQLLGLSGS
jgi:thiol:disulfide interchange protein DsbG